MTLRDWRDGVIFGAALGAVVLGVGGRIAMRLAALAVEQDPEFTIGGSATVVGAGAIAGAGAAALFLVIGVVPLLGRTGRTVAFWVGSLLIALAILWPVNQRRLELFLPLAAIFDAGLQCAWSWRRRRQSTVSSPATSP